MGLAQSRLCYQAIVPNWGREVYFFIGTILQEHKVKNILRFGKTIELLFCENEELTCAGFKPISINWESQGRWLLINHPSHINLTNCHCRHLSFTFWLIRFLFFIVAITNTATTTCFKGILTKVLPAKHVYHRVRKPAIIGYRGSILKHQENTLEGMKDLINRRFDGMHMEVQMLANEQLVLFGDNNFKVGNE